MINDFFINNNFLLQTKAAQHLYHNHAKNQPIIDYHCHLDPRLIAENYQFKNLTDLWLAGDHYKWRAMRANGIDEKFITGDASDWEKFAAWAKTVPYTMRNPLYHWTHLELKTAFGIKKLLNSQTACEIYEECNAKLQMPEFSARGLMKHYNVETVCTTDDPTDTLEHHIALKNENFDIKILPTWRPDCAMAVENTQAFCEYVEKLAKITNVEIRSFDDFLFALQIRQDFFHAQGCRLSDCGFEEFLTKDYSDYQIRRIFCDLLKGFSLKKSDIHKFRSAMLIIFAQMNWEKGWTQQFHYGVIRNNSTRLYQSVGADAGADSISNVSTVRSLAQFLDRLDRENHLTKTIIYNLNPADNEMIATMLGNFQDGSVAGKMQFGSAWWFLDQKDGMEKQINALSNLGLLSRFVGMLTDSRSFVSYPRHEYFRRILCNLIGNDIENGLLPVSEIGFLGKMLENISYFNAKNYFEF